MKALILCWIVVLIPHITSMTPQTCSRLQSYTVQQTRYVQTYCSYYQIICDGWYYRTYCHRDRFYRLCTKSYIEYAIRYREVPTCCPGYITALNGSCIRGCETGRYGSACEYSCTCPQNAYESCDVNTGNCTCLAGWTGNNCIEECPPGRFGEDCQNICICENNATCGIRDGSCSCIEPGWTGERCEKRCQNSTYGLNCQHNCECNGNQTCSPVNGECICQAGKRGDNCTYACEPYTFGPNCMYRCSCIDSRSTGCDPVNGTCHCTQGYTGPSCQSVCQKDWYGMNCESSCNCGETEVCDPTNGECISKCVCNAEGTDNCDIRHRHCPCTRNSNKTYCDTGDVISEERCMDTCDCIIPHSTCCISSTYNCSCKAGWSGPKCSQICASGKFGINCLQNCSCPHQTGCHHVTGECFNIGINARKVNKRNEHVAAQVILILLAVIIIAGGLFLIFRFNTKARHWLGHLLGQTKSCTSCLKKKVGLSNDSTQRYLELQEDQNPDWLPKEDNYDHLKRSRRAKQKLKFKFEDQSSNIYDKAKFNSIYNKTTEPLDKTTNLEDDYSHFKPNQEQGAYDQVIRMQNQGMITDDIYNKIVT